MPDWRAYVRQRLDLREIRPDVQQDVIEELASQLEEAYREAVQGGSSDSEAVAVAVSHVSDWPALANHIARSSRRALTMRDRLELAAGDAAAADHRSAGVVAALLFDVRLLLRTRRHRGYFRLASSVLAVGVGINLLVFTVVNALWLRPLPFPDASRLVTITSHGYSNLAAPVLGFFDGVAGQAMTHDNMGALRPRIEFDHVSREIESVGVTPEYFGFFGLSVRGRDFTADDNRAGSEPVAIISDRFWAREFDRDPSVIGAVRTASPIRLRIIGVAPAGFEGARRGERVDIWLPSNLLGTISALSGHPQSTVVLMAFARLRPGETPLDATQRISAAGIAPRAVEGLTIVPLSQVFGTPNSRTIVVHERNAVSVVAGLAMLVLLGGCATLAALVLVHYERRRRDQAVKIALGASRVRLTGELLLELGLVAVMGTIGAIAVAKLGLRAIPSLSLPGGVDLSRLDLSMDWRVLAVAVAASASTLMMAAWLPVSRFTRARLAGELIGGAATTASPASQRIRQSLLALHVTATIVVLVAAGLFVRAVLHGFGTAPGFAQQQTGFLTVQFPFVPPSGGQADSAIDSIAAQTQRVWERLRTLPEVESVAVGSSPIGPERARSLLVQTTVDVPGRQSHEMLLGKLFGSSELLSTLGVPILSGRGLTVSDAGVNPRPAIVTASLARTLWPSSDPLGQVWSAGVERAGGRYEVVGVAQDFVFGSLARPATGVVVTAQSVSGFGTTPQFVLRVGSPDFMAQPIQRAISEVAPTARVLAWTTGVEIVARDLGQQRLGAWFFSGFGLTALLLGVGGVFGLVAYMAESRQREFGVRLALGASAGNLVWCGLVAALLPVSIGVLGGLVVAGVVARLFTSLLTGLSAVDPLTYCAVAFLMLSCAGLAGLAAAWRLRRMVPLDALRID